MSSIAPVYDKDGITVYCADCRDVLPTLGQVDMVLTDPPYRSLDADVLSGTTTRLVKRNGKRLAETDEEWFNTLDACELRRVIDDCRSLLRSTGALYVFGDVKSGLELFAGWARNVLVWDKGSIGMGYAWRRMHEWIAYEPMREHRLRDQSRGDILRFAGVTEKRHPTEKPIGLLQALLQNSTDPGDLVLDPFGGSLSTAVACKQLGRRCITIELNEEWCNAGIKRLEATTPPLFVLQPEKSVQETLL